MEFKELFEHGRRLLQADLPPLPLCKPTGHDGRCFAHWHGTPCERIGKRPLIKGYPELAINPMTQQELVNLLWWGFPCNLGIVTGGSVVAIEADSLAGEQEIWQMMGHRLNSVPTRERRLGRGRAWLFQAPPNTSTSNRTGLGRSGRIDFRGSGGLLVVPPSIHYTGHQYTWVSGLSPWEISLPPLPEELIALCIEEKPPQKTLAPRGENTPGVLCNARLSSQVGFLLSSRLELKQLWEGKGKSHGDQSRSGIDFSLAKELFRARVPKAEVLIAIAIRPGNHRRDLDYAHRTVEAALRSLGSVER
jgi:hypothetical protein